MENMTLGEKYDFRDLMSNVVKKREVICSRPSGFWNTCVHYHIY